MHHLDEMYERRLDSQAIEELEAGADASGWAEGWLLSRGICPHCYQDLALQTIGVCENPECDQYQVSQCSL